MASICKIMRTTIPQTKTGLRSYNSEDSMYDSRKYGHNLSSSDVTPPFDVETLKSIPSGVFRETQGEILGLGASKKGVYKNPEYFSYHHMSFYDLHMGMRQFRKDSPDLKRKPT